jgi:hypothetical protein
MTTHANCTHDTNSAARAACRRAAATRVSHIIRNTDIALTECGQILRNLDLDPQDRAPQAILGSQHDIAIWDDAERPAGYAPCDACWIAYQA